MGSSTFVAGWEEMQVLRLRLKRAALQSPLRMTSGLGWRWRLSGVAWLDKQKMQSPHPPCSPRMTAPPSSRSVWATRGASWRRTSLSAAKFPVMQRMPIASMRATSG